MTTSAKILLIESHTLARLDQLKHELIALKQLPERTTYETLQQQYADRLKQLAIRHRQRKEKRDRNRTHYHSTLQGKALTKALNTLKRESQQDSRERRHLKQERDQALTPLAEKITQAEQHIQNLKQQYTTLSQQWQTQLQTAYAAERAVGREKLRLERSGQFYAGSLEDCQMPISQLSAPSQSVNDTLPLTILYHDESVIVVEKPAGLLSVPGRRYHQQDSVLSRLRCQLPATDFLQTVHRLDQATSGLLVLAKSPSAHKALGQQFSQRQVHKTYAALLSRPVAIPSGTVELPLWGNPDDRPKQSVDAVRGKPSVTHFQILQTGQHPRVQFVPHTGRTHQLRVHAAHPQGLNSPILGDSLYGQSESAARLHLHATSIQFVHPVTQKRLQFTSNVPF